MGFPDVIILPTSLPVRKFVELTSRMTVADYDLDEIMSIVVETLNEKDQVNCRVDDLILSYTTLAPGYESDSRIIGAALGSLIKELSFMVDKLQLRDKYGCFNYYFSRWHNVNNDAVLTRSSGG